MTRGGFLSLRNVCVDVGLSEAFRSLVTILTRNAWGVKIVMLPRR